MASGGGMSASLSASSAYIMTLYTPASRQRQLALLTHCTTWCEQFVYTSFMTSTLLSLQTDH